MKRAIEDSQGPKESLVERVRRVSSELKETSVYQATMELRYVRKFFNFSIKR